MKNNEKFFKAYALIFLLLDRYTIFVCVSGFLYAPDFEEK